MIRRRDLSQLSTKQLRDELKATHAARIVRADKLGRIEFELVRRKRVRRAERPIPACKCKDCGVNVIKSGEYYMVSVKIWEDKLHMRWKDNLCIGCLESRLGRKLSLGDFITFPPNTIGGISERYHRRVVGEKAFAEMKRSNARKQRP